MISTRTRLASLLVAAAALLLGSCGNPPRPTNLLLVTLDTTRADHLGAYGYAAARTPNLDQLAASGVLFERAYAVAPETLPSHSSLMTGLYPPSHGARLNGTYRLDDSLVTLADVFQGEAFFTAGVVSAAILDPQFGLDQGFDEYDAPEGIERPAEQVTQRGLELLEEAGDRPFFLWLHYYDAHSPFDPPEPYRLANAAPESTELYDGEIAYVDHWVGRVLDSLREKGDLEDTLVVVVADHGESLGDHGETYHTHFIYDSTIRVPLILSGPGIPESLRVEESVTSLDLFATVIESFGFVGPVTSSVSLPLSEGSAGSGSAAERGLFSETLAPKERYGWSPLSSLRTNDWTYVEAPQEELYPAGAAPGAVNRLVDPSREEVRELQAMRKRMTALRETIPSGPSIESDGDDRRLSDEDQRKLEALGYLGASSGAEGKASDDTGLGADPKDVVEVAEAISLARLASRQGQLPLAEQLLAWASAADPESAGILLQLGRVRSGLRRFDEAYEDLLNADRLRPASPEVLAELAAIGEVLGRSEATVHLEAAITVTKVPVEIWLSIARARIRTRSPESAREALQKVLELDGEHKGALTLLERLESVDSSSRDTP